MRYYEISINTPTEEIDARCDWLTELGITGFVIENEEDFRSFLENNRQYWDYVDKELEQQYAGVSRIKCYLTEDDDGARQLEIIRGEFGKDVSSTFVEEADWANNWRNYYKPIEIGQKLVVVPEWQDVPDDGRMPLRLDPGLIFGTGSHPTTKMCLAALEKYAAPGKKVLDLGCGSGILGIGALVLGCDSCLGVDIDPKAPDVVMANAALNGIGKDRMKALAGDVISDNSLRKSFGTGYPIVLANIVADVIIPLSAFVRQFMAEDGVFITSGIIDWRVEDVKKALIGNGFTILQQLTEEEWNCFICK